MNFKKHLDKIKEIPTKELARVAGVGINMAGKYKRGDNLPPLDKAILIKQKLKIPTETWLLLQKELEVVAS